MIFFICIFCDRMQLITGHDRDNLLHVALEFHGKNGGGIQLLTGIDKIHPLPGFD